MTNSFSRRLLAGLRLGVGVTSLVSPALATRMFGVDPASSNGWVTRLFGSRELALAVGLLTARPDQVSTVARVGAVIDAIDVASSVLEFARGRISVYTVLTGGGGAAVFAVLGADAARRAPAVR